jgi:1,2-phenylacetyl-CoA epoxidase PaaB subunit
MSKRRQNIDVTEGDLASPPEGDFAPYVIFTQLTESRPYVYAGWVDAVDDRMALQFGREHYGQDQKCVSLWAIPRPAISGTSREFPTSDEASPPRRYEVFTQRRSGDQHVGAGSVEATSSEAALQAARQQLPGDNIPHSIWVVPRDRIATTRKGDVIWRLTDQGYRMARGYAADVRDKWEKIRARRDLEEYEKDDLTESF